MSPWLGVDVGGTFTDFVSIEDGAPLQRIKRASTPDDPAEAVLSGVRELDPSGSRAIVHGTTVATNALLEGRGARTAFVTTSGFRDLLALGRGHRRGLYDLCPVAPRQVVGRDDCFELCERVGPGGVIVQPLSIQEASRVAGEVATGQYDAVAVTLLFSYADARHERLFGRQLRQLSPELFVSLSCDVLPEMREAERASTTAVNAYLGPVVAGYIGRLEKGAAPRPLLIMGSHAGTLRPDEAMRLPVATLLSGPAAGVAAAVALGRRAGLRRVLSFDMGGTSTDVALCDGAPPMTAAAVIDGLPVHRATVDVHTVGAGGGSIVRIDAGGALRVGPHSAGARPGPASYGLGGREPTITDANVVLGRLPRDVPLGDGQMLNRAAAFEVFDELGTHIGASAVDMARAALSVAEAMMERALRTVSVMRGIDVSDVAIVAFGGAGPLHAAALAEALGMTRVLVPASPGTLSALGLLLSPPAASAAQTVLGAPVEGSDWPHTWLELERKARSALELPAPENVRPSSGKSTPLSHRPASKADSPSRASIESGVCHMDVVRVSRSAELRYRGQGHALSVPWHGTADQACAAFEELHQSLYGFRLVGRPVELVTLRVRAERDAPALPPVAGPLVPRSRSERTMVTLSDGSQVDAPLLAVDQIRPRDPLLGPAVITHGDSTTWLPPTWTALRQPWGDILLEREDVDRY